jgi:hypothetical protein
VAVVSLVLKIGAVMFILAIPQSYAIQLKPRRLVLSRRSARTLRINACAVRGAVGDQRPGAALFHLFDLSIQTRAMTGYAALYSVLINFLIAFALAPIFDRIGRTAGAPAR